MPTLEEVRRGFTLGDWEVLPAQGLIRRGDLETRPEPKQMDVLCALAMRDGDVVSQNELIEEVWENRIFDNQPIQRSIAMLRKHFQDERPYDFIENLPRRGYRLLKPVVLHADALEAEDEPQLVPHSDRRWKAIAAFILVGFVALMIWLFWMPPGQKPPPIGSLAILPLANQTGDPAMQYAVDGIKDSLAQQLSELEGFTIKNIHQSDDGSATEVRQRLNVESILRGSLQAQGRSLRVIYHIESGEDGAIDTAGTVEGTIDDQFALHRNLAEAVRKAIAGDLTPELSAQRVPNEDAYQLFLWGRRALRSRGDGSSFEYAIGLFQGAIALDPDYGAPYLGLATALVLSPTYLKNADDVEAYNSRAIEKIEEGIARDSSIEEAAGAVFGFVYHQQKRWRESEENYERAVNASFKDPNAFNWYARMLSSVGRFDDALVEAQKGKDLDPPNSILASRIAMTYTWLGDDVNAQEYFEIAEKNKASDFLHIMAHTLFLVRTGQLDAARAAAHAAAAMQDVQADWIDPVFDAFADPAQSPAALAVVDRAWEVEEIPPVIAFMARAMLGDQDGAMEIAALLEGPGEPFATELLFIPETAALRQHPDFMPLLARLSIVDYWEQVDCRWDNDRVECEP